MTVKFAFLTLLSPQAILEDPFCGGNNILARVWTYEWVLYLFTGI